MSFPTGASYEETDLHSGDRVGRQCLVAREVCRTAAGSARRRNFRHSGCHGRILPEYKRTSGQNVSIEYEESAVIQQQVANGKVFDLAILVPQVIDELIN